MASEPVREPAVRSAFSWALTNSNKRWREKRFSDDDEVFSAAQEQARQLVKGNEPLFAAFFPGLEESWRKAPEWKSRISDVREVIEWAAIIQQLGEEEVPEEILIQLLSHMGALTPDDYQKALSAVHQHQVAGGSRFFSRLEATSSQVFETWLQDVSFEDLQLGRDGVARIVSVNTWLGINALIVDEARSLVARIDQTPPLSFLRFLMSQKMRPQDMVPMVLWMAVQPTLRAIAKRYALSMAHPLFRWGQVVARLAGTSEREVRDPWEHFPRNECEVCTQLDDLGGSLFPEIAPPHAS